MAVNTRSERNLNTPSDLQNQSFDSQLGLNLTEPVGFDGVNAQRMNADNMALKTTTVGDVVYLGIAAPGTAQASALWQCKKIDSSVAGTVVITFADGDANFNNVATDLTALTYA